MRIRIRHRLTFAFAEPARNLIHILKLTPRSHEGQRVSNWRIDVEPDCLLKLGEDHFGNLTHTLTVPGRAEALKLMVQGEIATFDVAGVVRGSAERLPADLYLRDTTATTPDAAIRAFAHDTTAGETDRIAKLHALMGALHQEIASTDDAVVEPAAAVLAGKRGNAEGLAQLFVACARSLDYPSRCVSGYRLNEGGDSHRHAWAEMQIDHFGWIGFDAVNDVCPQDFYIRTAIGLDATDATAIRGNRMDGLEETVQTTWMVGSDSALTDRAKASQAGDGAAQSQA